MSIFLNDVNKDEKCVKNITDQLPGKIKDMVYVEPCIYDADVLLKVKPYIALINSFDVKVASLYRDLIRNAKKAEFDTYDQMLSNDNLRYFYSNAITVFNAHPTFIIDMVLRRIEESMSKNVEYFVYLNKNVKSRRELITLSKYCTIMNAFDVRFMFQTYVDDRFDYDDLFSNFIIDEFDNCNLKKKKEKFIKNF